MKAEQTIPPMIEYKSVGEYERGRAEAFRNAALIGYGALLADNTGRYSEVIKAMDKTLFPTLGEQADGSPK